MIERIGLVGAGAMGGAIGTRLLETGNALTVFDLDPEKVAALTAKGATAAASAAEAARGNDFVITSLNASHIVGIAAFGDDGIAEGAAPGTVIIDMSRSRPTRPATSPPGPPAKASAGSTARFPAAHPWP